MPKYSVVVPIYNSRKYLTDCVRSILRQSYKDFEILLIDDGSEDGSGDICDQLSADDIRISVIHNRNSGAAKSRNVGIDSCRGDYIWFVDSDDRLSTDSALQKIDSIISAEQPDIIYFKSRECTCDFNSVLKEQEDYRFQGYYSKGGENLLVDLEKNGQLAYIATSPVNKVFRKSLLNDNCLRFVEKFKCHEEDELLCKVAFYSSSVYFFNETLYDVRVRQNSLSTNHESEALAKKTTYLIEITSFCLEFYKNKSKKVQNAMNRFYSYYFLQGIKNYHKLGNEQKQNLIDTLKSNENIFCYMFKTNSYYLKAIAIIYYLFGIKFFLKIIYRM